ncbi:MAG: hypothetical protein LBL81_02315 [Tannerella sp.]|jgi:hypothetical protein|nr:hypothetical protein [Tannerella sp.]
MNEDDYTFVTIDDSDPFLSDAVVIDMDDSGNMADAITIDDGSLLDMDGGHDFISLADDTIMLSDTDLLDAGSANDMGDWDISIL